eukprot:260129-Chlamydomonas_euryale.AAC.1
MLSTRSAGLLDAGGPAGFEESFVAPVPSVPIVTWEELLDPQLTTKLRNPRCRVAVEAVLASGGGPHSLLHPPPVRVRKHIPSSKGVVRW